MIQVEIKKKYYWICCLSPSNGLKLQIEQDPNRCHYPLITYLILRYIHVPEGVNIFSLLNLDQPNNATNISNWKVGISTKHQYYPNITAVLDVSLILNISYIIPIYYGAANQLTFLWHQKTNSPIHVLKVPHISQRGPRGGTESWFFPVYCLFCLKKQILIFLFDPYHCATLWLVWGFIAQKYFTFKNSKNQKL